MSYGECYVCRFYGDCPHCPRFDSEVCEFFEPSRMPEAEAEIERLKVCGNCKYTDATVPCAAWQDCQCVPSDQCHFTPSRWQAREEAGDE